MAVCYLFSNYEIQYKCEYHIEEDFIEAEIADYDIADEIAGENEIRMFGIHTRFEKRDILIIDHQSRTNYLLKNAYYAGENSVYGRRTAGAGRDFGQEVTLNMETMKN